VDTNIILLTNHRVFTSYRIVIVVWGDLGLIVNAIPRPKKNTCGSGFPTDPIFFLPTLLFFSTGLTVRPYFLRVVAGCSHSVPKWRLSSQ
jgi:hypothetical protein